MNQNDSMNQANNRKNMIETLKFNITTQKNAKVLSEVRTLSSKPSFISSYVLYWWSYGDSYHYYSYLEAILVQFIDVTIFSLKSCFLCNKDTLNQFHF